MPSLVRQYSTVNEAVIAKSFLEQYGLTVWLWNEQIIRTNWFYSLAVGEVRLYVLMKDLDVATKLLTEVERTHLESKENTCPSCGSTKVIHYSRYTFVQLVIIFMVVAFPPPMKYGFIKCLHCKADFFDDLNEENLVRAGLRLITVRLIIVLWSATLMVLPFR
ncbi:MAG: hypothetical protein COA81_10270 [Alphaproteobacteria bacterium]|nr:MAG: hypothetical protein COA81_10270 [Alphaproteobacteria bacterium]